MLLTREQLQERLIALHKASVALVENVSVDDLLHQITQTACEQSGADFAAVGVLDEQGGLEQFITVGMTNEEVHRIDHPPVGLGLIGALMDATEPIRVPSIGGHPKSVGFPKNHPVMIPFLGVPIRTAELQLGQIYLTKKENAPEFTEDDERIIQMLATYAATAITNARLYERMRERDIALTRRNVDMALLNGIASTLTSSLNLDEILDKTLELVMNYMKVEAGEIFLLAEDRRTLNIVLHRGEAAKAFWTRNEFKMGEGFIGIVAETRKPLVSTDLKNDNRFLRGAVVQAEFDQIACIPLLSGENLMGVMSVARMGDDPIDDRSIDMMAAVGAWAGLAIENARLHANARRLAVLEERERIGMDLHDGIIQSIYGVGLTLENALHALEDAPGEAMKRIKTSIEGLNQTIRDLRSYIMDLRPRQMGDEGLTQGIKRLIAEFRANTLAEIQLTEPDSPLEDLPTTHETALFHICQEALSNIAKHAKAKKVQISIWTSGERVLMEIVDDGKGFDSDDLTENPGHGLSNMRTRTHSIGGDIDITSVIGEGTTIFAWVPRVKLA